MKTQIEFARDMQITPQMLQVGKDEEFEPEIIREKVALGQIVIPCNPGRKNQNIAGIDAGLRTKANASIGTSSGISDINEEIVKATSLPVGNVPHYRGEICNGMILMNIFCFWTLQGEKSEKGAFRRIGLHNER